MRTNTYSLRVVDSNGEVVMERHNIKWGVLRHLVEFLGNDEMFAYLLEYPGFGIWRNPLSSEGYRRDRVVEWIRYDHDK